MFASDLRLVGLIYMSNATPTADILKQKFAPTNSCYLKKPVRSGTGFFMPVNDKKWQLVYTFSFLAFNFFSLSRRLYVCKRFIKLLYCPVLIPRSRTTQAKKPPQPNSY